MAIFLCLAGCEKTIGPAVSSNGRSKHNPVRLFVLKKQNDKQWPLLFIYITGKKTNCQYKTVHVLSFLCGFVRFCSVKNYQKIQEKRDETLAKKT